MRKVHLAPRFKLWLILGTTAGLFITALLALMLAWGPPPVFETPKAATTHGNLSDSRPILAPLHTLHFGWDDGAAAGNLWRKIRF